MTAIFHRPYPWIEATGTVCLAALVTSLTRGRGWRVIYILFLQALVFTIVLIKTVYVFNEWSYAVFDPHWLAEFVTRPKEFLEWVLLVMVLLSVVMFWAAGISLVKKPIDYLGVCTRFDTGVAFLILLYLIKYLLAVQNGIRINDPAGEYLFWPFFFLSLVAIVQTRNYSNIGKEYLAGYHGMGVILSFIMVVLLVGIGTFVLLMPFLNQAAKTGYVIMRDMAEPFGPVLVSVLRFLFAPRNLRDELGSASSDSNSMPLEEGGSFLWAEAFFKYFGFILFGLAVLLALIMIGFIAWLLLKWLFSKTAIDPKQDDRQDNGNMLTLLWLWLQRVWFIFRALVSDGGYGPKEAPYFYAGLLKWGRRSGLAVSISETPAEYGGRLKHHFPVVKDEIDLIINIFNQKVYGQVATDHKQLAFAHDAWHRLQNPIHWARRLKIWYFHGGNPGTSQ
ncbi:DUF4129 domain-containing protein [Thermodesulfobacteriota bacterium]